MFGQIAQSYFQRHGDQSDALAMIAAKNHRNGVANPYAQMRKDLGFAFCRAESEKNPFVAGPLKRTDCSLVSDGAAALVIADGETAAGMERAVAFRATAHAQDFLPMSKRDILKFEGCAEAWRRALGEAELTLADLSFVETHDCFTIAELIEYEAMGLVPEGQGARAIQEGWTEKERQAARQPVGRTQIQGASDRRDRGVDACAERDAALRRGRGHPGSRMRRWPVSSTWAVRRSRTTSASWSVRGRRDRHNAVAEPAGAAGLGWCRGRDRPKRLAHSPPGIAVTFAVLLSAYLLSQFFRAFLAVVAGDLSRDLGLSAADLGSLPAAWLIAFALAQFPIGLALDRFGARRTMAAFMSAAIVGAAWLSRAGGYLDCLGAMALIGIGCAPILMAGFYLAATALSGGALRHGLVAAHRLRIAGRPHQRRARWRWRSRISAGARP